MAALENILPEGSSTTKPPGFDGKHYTFWKLKMKIFIKANGYKLWKIIEEGDIVPKKESGAPKTESEFSDEDIANLELNSKAILMIQSALSQTEFFRISHLDTAKEMWDALQIAHEGTSGVRDNRVDTLVDEFHKFEMQEGERVRDIEIRFTHLINNLAALGHKIPEKEQVRKILNVMKGDWLVKITTLKGLKGEDTRSITALFGSLAEHEPTLLAEREAQNASKKKKSLALAANDDEDSDDDEESLDDEDMALMVRKFKKFYKRRGKFQKGGSSSRKDVPKDKAPVCYECKKPGHYRSECPTLQRFKEKEKKKSFGKKKAFVSSIWGDSSGEESDEEEECANLCLVAQEEQSENEVNDSEPSYSDLQDMYNEMHAELLKLAKQIVILRKENKVLKENLSTSSLSSNSKKTQSLSIEEKLTIAPSELSIAKPLTIEDPPSATPDSCSECEKLLKENGRLSTTLEKFSNGSKMLKVILKEQKAYKNRRGIGYIPKKQFPKKTKFKEKPYMRYFRKASDSASSYSFCNYCNRKGHTQASCRVRKYGMNSNYKWVPKGTYIAKVVKNQELNTDPKGPKKVWVPKSV